MKEITNDLRMDLKDHFGSIAQIENVDANRTDSDYWANKLKVAKWCIEKGEKNYFDLALSQIKDIKVCRNNAIIVAQLFVTAERKSEEETIYIKKYDDLHTKLSDYGYQISKENFKEQLDKYLGSHYLYDDGIISKKKVYDVTSKGQKDVPDCSECHGQGVVPCMNCDEVGFTICENCDGTGMIEYSAGNYADGTQKIKSKECPICNGKGKIKCPSCHGTGKQECPKCHGFGKEQKTDCVQCVKSFTDTYYLDKTVECYLAPSDENQEFEYAFGHDNFIRISSDWFKPYNLSQLFDQNGHLVVDNSQMIATQVCGTIQSTKDAFNKIRQHTVFDNFKDDDDNIRKNVCLIENYYKLENVLTLTIKHNIDDIDDLVLYIYDGNVWSYGYYNISFTEKMKIMLKNKIKEWFKK